MNFSYRIYLRTITLIFTILVTTAPLSASAEQFNQEGDPTSIAASDLYLIYQGEIENYIELAESSQELSPSKRKQVIDFFKSAIRYRQLVAEYREEADRLNAWVQSAPDRIAQIKTMLDKPLPSAEILVDEAERLTLSDIDKEIRLGEINLVQATTNLKIWQDQITYLSLLPRDIRTLISASNKRSEEIRREYRLKKPGDDIYLMRVSRIAVLESEQRKNRAFIRLTELKLSGSAVVIELFYAERNLAKRQILQNENRLKTLRQLKQAKLRQSVEVFLKRTQDARKQLGVVPQAVKKQFDLNFQLGEELESLIETDFELGKRFKDRQQRLEKLIEEFSRTVEKTDATIYSKSVGMWLREKHQSLPELEDLRQRFKLRRNKIDELQANRLEVVNQLNQLARIEPEKRRIMATLITKPQEKQAEISDKIDRILYTRRDLLEALLKRYERSLGLYRQLGFIDQQISITAKEYKDYLEQVLLWLQDSEIFGVRELMNLPEAISWFTDRQKWGRVVKNVQAAYQQQTVLWVIVLIGGTLLLASGRWRYRQLVLLSKNVGHIGDDSILLTLRGLVLTLILAADIPIVMGFMGYQLTLVSESQEFSEAIGKGLINAAVKLVLIRFLLQLFRENSLAQLHFGWRPEIGTTMHRTLLWLLWLVVPSAFLYTALQESANIPYSDSLGRLAYMMMMVSGGLFTAWLLRQSGALFTTLKKQASNSLIVRTWPIWYVLTIGPLFCLGGIAGVGYYYTALILDQPVQRTIILGLVLIITSNILVRWLLISRRRIEHDQFLKQQEAQMQAVRGTPNDDADKVPGMDGEALAVHFPAIDYNKIEIQYLALLRFVLFFAAVIGLWKIWAEGLPVLNTLQNIEIWSYSVGIGDEIKLIPVTLKDLLITVIVAAATLVSVRNLSGILEVTLFRLLKPDTGTRNFFVALSRLIVIGIGVIVVFQIVGLHWSKLQWLIAALGVGLGFGLQEIVANFFSGLILVFERSYRVGDVVTIGSVSGTVTNIHVRATTITDWDMHELIVPNKEFISGQLINWSLSNPITRIVIPVGIAYGSDTELTEQLLLKLARNHKEVLDKPEPSALFRAFGDSSLDFELRVFTTGADRRLIVMHELLREIDRIFKDHGIHIAFPQQDVHMDTTRPLDVRMVKETKDTPEIEKASESSEKKTT